MRYPVLGFIRGRYHAHVKSYPKLCRGSSRLKVGKSKSWSNAWCHLLWVTPWNETFSVCQSKARAAAIGLTSTPATPSDTATKPSPSKRTKVKILHDKCMWMQQARMTCCFVSYKYFNANTMQPKRWRATFNHNQIKSCMQIHNNTFVEIYVWILFKPWRNLSWHIFGQRNVCAE